MDTKEIKNISQTEKAEATNKVVNFHAETPEELAKIMEGKIPEKDFQNIMGLVNAVKGKEQGIGNPIDKIVNNDVNVHKTAENKDIHKHIVLIKTNDSTRIIPVLTNSNVRLEISLDVSTSECENLPEDDITDFNISSNSKEINGVSPMIVIPHKYDGNDNQDSISKVIDFILSSYSEHVKVDELECHGVGISGKIINIIQKK